MDTFRAFWSATDLWISRVYRTGCPSRGKPTSWSVTQAIPWFFTTKQRMPSYLSIHGELIRNSMDYRWLYFLRSPSQPDGNWGFPENWTKPDFDPSGWASEKARASYSEISVIQNVEWNRSQHSRRVTMYSFVLNKSSLMSYESSPLIWWSSHFNRSTPQSRFQIFVRTDRRKVDDYRFAEISEDERWVILWLNF
jgi:hypothetical protein